MKKLLIVVVAMLSVTSCKKEVTKTGSNVVTTKYVQVWEKKSNCTSLDSLSDFTTWEVYAYSNEFDVVGELDTAHYFYRPTGIPNNFERFKYRKIN